MTIILLVHLLYCKKYKPKVYMMQLKMESRTQGKAASIMMLVMVPKCDLLISICAHIMRI